MKYCPHVYTLKFHNLKDKGKILRAPKMQQKDVCKEKSIQTSIHFPQQHWVRKEIKRNSEGENEHRILFSVNCEGKIKMFYP